MKFQIEEELQTRIITAVMLGIAILIAVFSDSYFIIWVLLGAGFMLAIHESLSLYSIKNNAIYAIALILWVLAPALDSPIHIFLAAILLFGSIVPFQPQIDKKLILPLIYPTLPFLALLELYTSFGKEALLWLIVTVAIVDIASYFGGKNLGKTPLCAMSPKKTIEGASIGIAMGTIFGAFISLLCVDFLYGLFVSLIISAVSVCGDLYESYLKREADVKDSGSIFPGHGGILDRIDGYLFSAIALLIALSLING